MVWLYIRRSTDESIWYGCTLDVQRMSSEVKMLGLYVRDNYDNESSDDDNNDDDVEKDEEDEEEEEHLALADLSAV
ncbi:hypothetical protein Tco_0379865, partial [Tanacetum coccineum]